MLTFPLSAFHLVCGLNHFFTKESRYRHLWFFFFCCQLGYFSIHSTNEFTLATAFKLGNNYKRGHLVDLVQMRSLTSSSGMSNPLLVALKCMMIPGLWSFSPPIHASSWQCDERKMAALFLAGTCDTSVRKPKIENRPLIFSLKNNAGISVSFFL